jgi:hypothetical protein
MRFKRSDTPGIAIAAFGPVALMVLFLESFAVWDHHGTPLLGFISANIAIALGVMAAFTRFVRNWDIPVGLFALLLLIVGGVIWAQETGNDGTAVATGLKWAGVLAFLALNVAIGFQVLEYGLMPVLDKLDARRAAARSQAEQQ